MQILSVDFNMIAHSSNLHKPPFMLRYGELNQSDGFNQYLYHFLRKVYAEIVTAKPLRALTSYSGLRSLLL